MGFLAANFRSILRVLTLRSHRIWSNKDNTNVLKVEKGYFLGSKDGWELVRANDEKLAL